MLKKVSLKSRIAIALLLIGSCVLTATIIPKAFGQNIDFDISFSTTGDIKDVVKDSARQQFAEDEGYISAWIYGYRVDDNGDVLGIVECNIVATRFNQDNVNYVNFFGYADSRLLSRDLKGKANAWVKLPNRNKVGPGGDVDVGNPNLHYLRIEDSYTVRSDQARGRRMEASAALSVKKARVSVKVTAVRN